MIAGESFGQFVSERLGFLLGYRRDDGHASARSPLADDPVSEEDEPVVDVGDMGFLHIQRQLQAAFQKHPAFLADGLGMCLGPLDDDHEVIGIAAIGDSQVSIADSREPQWAGPCWMPKFHAQRSLRAFLLRYFASSHSIKLMEHDVGQERRQDAALRNTLHWRPRTDHDQRGLL